MFLSIFMFPIVPFMIIFKSKKLNTVLNIIIYIIKFFIPFIIIYWAYGLFTLPIAYLRILICILLGKYSNQIYKPIKTNTSVKIVHFISFLFLGVFYLLFKLFIMDSIQLVSRIREKIQEELELYFTPQLYMIFKKTVL